MLAKIKEFFKSLFGSLFSSDSTTSQNTSGESSSTSIPKGMPRAKVDYPQDANEVDQDTSTTVEIVSEDLPVILEPEDDPAVLDPPVVKVEPVKEVVKEVVKEREIPASTEVVGDPIIITADTEEKPEVKTETEVKVTTKPKPKNEDVLVADPPEEKKKPRHTARYMWCLDNGHGKKTAGKRSPKFENGKQFLEYEFNRDIVKRMMKKLDEVGVKYYNVVPEVEIDNFLEGRVARANKLKSSIPKVFLSIHANAFGRSGWEPPSGIETWYFHGSRTGRAIARIFQQKLIDKLGWKNRKLKSYPGKKQFYVLRNTNMAAVLTENGFYTNKEECRLLMKSSVRQKIADAHVEAILEIEKNGL